MPRRLPTPTELVAYAPGRPLSRREMREAHAVRLALVFAVIAIYDDGSMPDHALIKPGFDARWDWLRRRLQPLAAYSAAVRHVGHILDLGYCSRVWTSLPAMRREVRRLDRLARRVAADMAVADGLVLPASTGRRAREDLFRVGRRHPARRPS